MIKKIVIIFIILCINNCTKEKITFFKHIAPIIHTNCTPCHRANQSGPFNLITYNDVAKRSKMIYHVTSKQRRFGA